MEEKDEEEMTYIFFYYIHNVMEEKEEMTYLYIYI